MKRGQGLLIFALLIVFSTQLIYANVLCDKTLLQTTYSQGYSSSLILTCANYENSSVSISTSGENSLFSLTPSSLPINSSVPINISFSSSAPVGLHSGSIHLGAKMIPVSFLVEDSEEEQGDILVFPTSKIITVQQGTEKTQNILITVPSTYPRTITLQSVDFNPNVETISFGDLNLGQVSPGQSVNIPILFSAKDASIGTYQTQLKIFATDSNGQVSLSPVNLQLQISAGITPSKNFSLDNLPSCSLSAVDLKINQTATLVCSRTDPNLDIRPIIDSFYLVGVESEKTNSQYVYTFRAKSLGNTAVIAEFLWNNGRIGELYNQSLRISHGDIIGGVELGLVFYQDGKMKDRNNLGARETIIHIVDNKTKAFLEDAKLYLGGVDLINKSISLQTNEFYELMASYPGYSPLYTNLTASEIPIPFIVNPPKATYSVGEIISITSEIENVSYLINNIIMPLPYTFTSPGNHTITAIREGYSDTNMNVSVIDAIFITLGLPQEDLKKGEELILDLNKNATWNVKFTDPSEDVNGNIIYNSQPESVASGAGSRIVFTPEKKGRYEIEAEGVIIATKYAESNWWAKPAWMYGVGAVSLFFIGVFIKGRIKVRRKKDDEGVDLGGAGVGY